MMKRRKNERISGVEYWRCKRQVRKSDIETILGGRSSYLNWARPDSLLETSSFEKLLKIADLLDVTADQLLEDHSVAELEDGDRPQRTSKHANPDNCISNYRIRNGLSFQQLADRLGGVSRQYAQEVCKTSCAPEAGIQRVCAYEKMTPKEFGTLYRNIQRTV